MVDLGLLTADLVLLMADLVLLIGGVLFDEVLGWRFNDFSGLVFSCWFGLDEFFMFWRFWWRIGILYEILHCSGFDCSWIWEEHEEQVLVFLAKKIMKAIIIIIISDLKVFFLI